MASINTNIAAYYAQANLRSSGAAAQASIARLSSGNAIVRASDDVAGLSIGTVLRTNVSTLKTASTNASQGSTLLQIADGAISSLGEILQRQKALAVQANSGTLGSKERGYLDTEFQSLTKEYNRIVSTTNFNGVNLLDGSISGSSALNGSTASTAFTVTGPGAAGDTILQAGGITLGTVTTSNNKIIGSQSGATVNIINKTASTNDVNVTLNGQNFTASGVDLHGAANTTVTLTNSTGQTLLIKLTAAGTAAGNTTQTAVNALAASIQTDLQASNVYQTRTVDTTAGASTAIDANTFNGTSLQGLTGGAFSLKSNQYDAGGALTPAISGFAVSPYVSSTGTNGAISVKIGGDTYSLALTSSNTTSGKLSASTAYVLTDTSNSNNTFTITTGATQIPDVSTVAGANQLADTLNAGFGTGSNGGLSFQVGTKSSDSIGVSVGSLNTANVFKDATGAPATLTLAGTDGTNAQAASDVLDTAINTLTSARASVGALQERFNYASDTLSVSIQNLDAARGTFLDTDISAESTKYATEQVQQQAAISVLAQANQLPQNLLKLIGQ